MTLISIHILQNHAPSNLNRDENGDPKDCVFGGFRRARISSQSLKRSIRLSESFADNLELRGLLAQRSKLATHVENYLRTQGLWDTLSPQARKAIVLQAANLGMAKKDKGEKADDSQEDDGEEPVEVEKSAAKGQLVFLTQQEVQQVAEKLVALSGQVFMVKAKGKKKEKGEKAEKEVSFAELDADELRKRVDEYDPHSVDIAMFGRMTTSSPFKDIEAAVQVAHAISTHEIDQEFDFFTAVDDLETNPGAGLLGETAFNSATYYKYINIHWEALVENLHGDEALALETIAALVRAATLSIPSGKQNSFAAHNLPDFVLVERRERNIPLSYANAFLRPVRARRDISLMEASVSALCDYGAKINRMYELEPTQAFITTIPDVALNGAVPCETFDQLLLALGLSRSETQ